MTRKAKPWTTTLRPDGNGPGDPPEPHTSARKAYLHADKLLTAHAKAGTLTATVTIHGWDKLRDRWQTEEILHARDYDRLPPRQDPA